jgi:hypothetical protein
LKRAELSTLRWRAGTRRTPQRLNGLTLNGLAFNHRASAKRFNVKPFRRAWR